LLFVHIVIAAASNNPFASGRQIMDTPTEAGRCRRRFDAG
jgi:hypothetical protein